MSIENDEKNFLILIISGAYTRLYIQSLKEIFIIKDPPNNFFVWKCLKKTGQYFLKFLFYLNVLSFRLIMEKNFIQMATSADRSNF